MLVLAYLVLFYGIIVVILMMYKLTVSWWNIFICEKYDNDEDDFCRKTILLAVLFNYYFD